MIVVSKDAAKDGIIRYTVTISRFNLGLAGTLPVKPDTTVIDRLVTGAAIPAHTLGSVAFSGGRLRVEIPLPIRLSTDPPNGGYTPVPLRTAAPLINKRKPTPTPAALPSPAPTATVSATPSPLAT